MKMYKRMFVCSICMVIGLCGTLSAVALPQRSMQEADPELVVVFDDPQEFALGNQVLDSEPQASPETKPVAMDSAHDRPEPVAAVPEPATAWLFGLGIAGILYAARKIQRKRMK